MGALAGGASPGFSTRLGVGLACVEFSAAASVSAFFACFAAHLTCFSARFFSRAPGIFTILYCGRMNFGANGSFDGLMRKRLVVPPGEVAPSSEDELSELTDFDFDDPSDESSLSESHSLPFAFFAFSLFFSFPVFFVLCVRGPRLRFPV